MDKIKGKDIVPLGVGGIAYKKGLLDLEFLMDKKFLEIAPRTDDLWFKVAGLRKNTPVLVLPILNNGSYHINHAKGLFQFNKNKVKQSVIFVKQLKSFRADIIHYLGINQSQNDINWDKILDYSKSV